MRGIITAHLKVFGKYPNDNHELIIAKRGSVTSGSTSFSSLDGIGSNIYTILPKVLGYPLLMKGLTTLVISMSTNLNV